MSTARSTETSGFLDGKDYTASFLYEFCALLVGNGVYADELAPTAANDNMTITHGSGHAWINGVLYRNTTPFNLDIDIADGSLNRYDSLMLRLDLSQNETYAVVVKGDFATSPTPPAVTRNAETFDLKICDIYIPAGCTKITQDKIIDTRLDTSVCGVPVFLVDHLDMSTFYRQVNADLADFRQKEQADFAAWTDEQRAEIADLLDQLKGLIGSDAVGELVIKINEKLPKAGGDMSGAINMNNNPITGLRSPQENSEPATREYVDSNQKPTFTEETSLTNLTSGENLKVMLGKIAKAISSLISHINNKNNPHVVTLEQVGGQAPITVFKKTGVSANLSKGTVGTITSLSVEAGTYLVCANATFPQYSNLEKAEYTHMLGINTSTSFDHGKAINAGNVKNMNMDLNVSTVITLSSAGTIYMLGYAAAASTVTNGNLYAIKIG